MSQFCEECGELWNSEYHMSDVCVNINEDKEVKDEETNTI